MRAAVLATASAHFTCCLGNCVSEKTSFSYIPKEYILKSVQHRCKLPGARFMTWLFISGLLCSVLSEYVHKVKTTPTIRNAPYLCAEVVSPSPCSTELFSVVHSPSCTGGSVPKKGPK